MNVRTLLATTLLVAPTLAFAQTPPSELPAGNYTIDPTHASLTWKVNHLGLSNYTARFTKLDATIDFDPKDVTKSVLVVDVDPNSLETDYPYPEKKDFDAKLIKDKEWFNAVQFPSIRFQSTNIVKTGENTGKVMGELTFLGVTKPMSLNVTFNGGMAEHPYAKKAAMGFSATGSLKRSDWGMNSYIPNIGDEVQLLIEAEFVQE